MVQQAAQVRLRVLLADRDNSWQEAARLLLEPHGVQTLTVRTGRDALEIIERREVHVAVLDQEMPQLNGLQIVRMAQARVEARGETRGETHGEAGGPAGTRAGVVPAILLTQSLTNHLLQQALGNRVFSVLSKPVQLEVLLDTLARVVRRHYEDRWPVEFQPTSNNPAT
ncbi:MAG: response regulator [Phycisphaerae bacterium]